MPLHSLSVPTTHASSVDALCEFVHGHPRLLALTGAGISVSSGIPAYRDNNGVWKRNNPIQHRDFVQREASRQRYWARSFAGWPAVQAASPNPAHTALATLEARGTISLLVTQNVDRLHQRAGHRQVIDLHGRLDQVVCLDCGAYSQRADMQERLAQANPHLQRADRLFPDGDADVPDALVEAVVIPACRHCGGVLKPDVVFFGDSVNRDRVAAINAAIEEADALLVIGSSLMVFSGYRFCRHAAQQNIPIACINAGMTRADDLFTVKVEADCASVLQHLVTSYCS